MHTNAEMFEAVSKVAERLREYSRAGIFKITADD